MVKSKEDIEREVTRKKSQKETGVVTRQLMVYFFIPEIEISVERALPYTRTFRLFCVWIS